MRPAGSAPGVGPRRSLGWHLGPLTQDRQYLRSVILPLWIAPGRPAAPSKKATKKRVPTASPRFVNPFPGQYCRSAAAQSRRRYSRSAWRWPLLHQHGQGSGLCPRRRHYSPAPRRDRCSRCAPRPNPRGVIPCARNTLGADNQRRPFHVKADALALQVLQRLHLPAVGQVLAQRQGRRRQALGCDGLQVHVPHQRIEQAGAARPRSRPVAPPTPARSSARPNRTV